MRELARIFLKLPREACVLDIGCFGFQLVRETREIGPEFRHFGVDFTDYDQVPEGFTYRKADLNCEGLPYDDDSMDIVVANHIMEHLKSPIDFVSECIRVCKPGAFIFISTPSERSLFLPGMPFAFEKFHSSSFFDDPTHLGRPWTPQSLFRLAKYLQCEPLMAAHSISWKARLAFPILVPYAILTRDARLLEQLIWGAVGWTSFVVIQKPADLCGAPRFSYYIPSRNH